MQLMQIRVALVGLALCGVARAQFSQFSWTLGGSTQGSGSVTATQMHLVGPDSFGGCSGGDVTWFAAVTTAPGTVRVHFSWKNHDMGIGFWTADSPEYIVGGVETDVDSGVCCGFEYMDFEQDVSFHVAASQGFGFGAASIDCLYGPGELTLTDFSFEPDGWPLLGPGLAGLDGVPNLVGFGTMQPGAMFTLSLVDAKPLAPAWLVLGTSPLLASFKGGVLAPLPLSLLSFTTSIAGRIVIIGPWPAGVPSGLTLIMQYWISDAAGPKGWSASNGVAPLTP